MFKIQYINRDIFIVSECLSNFEHDQDVLKNAFVKKCVLCNNLDIGKIDKYVMKCKERTKCTNVKYMYLNYHLKFVIFVNLIKTNE